MDTDVLVIGAGPTGMTLANELLVAGVSTVLVDKLSQRSDLPKAGGVQTRTQEALDQRGLLEPLLATGDHPVMPGHFAGVMLPPQDLTRHRLQRRIVPQVELEGFFEHHLAAHGVHVRRDHELIGLAQDESGVTATFAGGATLRSRYLVAADGAHSTVRSLLGAEFSGRVGTSTLVTAVVRLSGADHEPLSHKDGHWASLVPLGTDSQGRELFRLSMSGPGRSRPRDVPVTEDEIRDGLRMAFGSRVQLLELLSTDRISDVARQAEQYRHGRVFLAGDAAHVHLPIGAQGMNTGMQDAFNLGWKLGAAVHGWAPEHLLDSYHTERHPIGAAVLRNVQAQALLMDWEGTRDPDVAATSELFAALAQLPAVQEYLNDLLSAMGSRYPMPGTEAHPLTGLPSPDLDLGPVRVHELLRSGRGVLLDPADTLAKVANLWSDRVDRVGQGADTEPMLIRPDGHVCWAGNADGLEPALGRWFGAPRG